MSGRHYPFYAVQFHPEKNLFLWDSSVNVAHDVTSVRFAQALATLLVQEGSTQILIFFSCVFFYELPLFQLGRALTLSLPSVQQPTRSSRTTSRTSRASLRSTTLTTST